MQIDTIVNRTIIKILSHFTSLHSHIICANANKSNEDNFNRLEHLSAMIVDCEYYQAVSIKCKVYIFDLTKLV